MAPSHSAYVVAGLASLAAAWLHPWAYWQAVRWGACRLGFAKAMLFCLVLRWHWLPASPDAELRAFAATVRSRELVAFEPPLASSPTRGFLFLPGALVHPHAYAPILERLANSSGVLCVCVKPPFRHPALWTADPANALGVMRRFPHVRAWTVAGHSMGGGGYGAALVASRLAGSERVVVDSLVMWASVITQGTGVDLSRHARLRSLVVLASEDTVVPPNGKVEDGSRTRANLHRFGAPRTRLVVVPGGNHGGFGHYGPQTFPRLDRPRTISLAAQQSRVVHHTALFLRSLRLPRAC